MMTSAQCMVWLGVAQAEAPELPIVGDVPSQLSLPVGAIYLSLLPVGKEKATLLPSPPETVARSDMVPGDAWGQPSLHQQAGRRRVIIFENGPH
jgi:hypothetical protein